LIQAKVIKAWQKLSARERKEIRRRSVRASDGVMRCRCKVILGLVQGKTPTMIAQGGLCAKSQVYRVAYRFIEHGLVGLADRREDNGRTRSPTRTAWNCFASSKVHLKSTATGVPHGHRSY
jgi:Winged helix-turn helix